MADIKIKKRILSVCQTNCYYVYREGADEIVVIDPGDMGDVVYEDVRSLGFTRSQEFCLLMVMEIIQVVPAG